MFCGAKILKNQIKRNLLRQIIFENPGLFGDNESPGKIREGEN
jgi:hypothetical protein